MYFILTWYSRTPPPRPERSIPSRPRAIPFHSAFTNSPRMSAPTFSAPADSIRSQPKDDLLPGDRVRFNERFTMLYNWCRQLKQTVPSYQMWISGPDHLGVDFWCDVFESGLSIEAKRLLASVEAPTVEAVLDLGWEGDAVGAYAKIAVSTDPDSIPHAVYVGYSGALSGSNRSFGIGQRRRQHERDWQVSYIGGGFADITKPNKDAYELQFASLWTSPFSRSELDPTTLQLARVGAHFAEFMWSKWLSAYRPGVMMGKRCNVWEYEEIDWVGTLSASCLLEGWVEEERLSVKDPAEYARIWAHGGHLAGMLTLDQVIEWRRKRLDRRNATEIHGRNIPAAELTPEEHRARRSRANELHTTRAADEEWKKDRNEKERARRVKDRAEGKPPPDRTKRNRNKEKDRKYQEDRRKADKAKPLSERKVVKRNKAKDAANMRRYRARDKAAAAAAAEEEEEA